MNKPVLPNVFLGSAVVVVVVIVILAWGTPSDTDLNTSNVSDSSTPQQPFSNNCQEPSDQNDESEDEELQIDENFVPNENNEPSNAENAENSSQTPQNQQESEESEENEENEFEFWSRKSLQKWICKAQTWILGIISIRKSIISCYQ